MVSPSKRICATALCALAVLAGCASRTNVVSGTGPEPPREENSFVYTPSDGRHCWTALEPGAAGPTPEEIELYADPEIPDEMPRVIFQSHPHLRASGVAHLSGRVVVNVLVDPTGRVVQACLGDSTDSPLDEVAVASAFKWKFEPGTKGGLPVSVWVSLPFLFEGRP